MPDDTVDSMRKPISLLFAFAVLQAALLMSHAAEAGVPPGEYAEGEALVLMEAPASHAQADAAAYRSALKASADALAGSLGAEVASIYESIAATTGVSIVHIRRDGLDTGELLAMLDGMPGVLGSSPNYVSHASRTPNDPLLNSLWGMSSSRAIEAWDLSTGASGVIVAVLDTGIDRGHEDLSVNVTRDKDGEWGLDAINKDRDPMDDNGHGTHVAGIIGAAGDNGRGVVGVNWSVGLLGVKVLNAAGQGYESQIIAGLDYVVEQKRRGLDIRVANMSLTGWRQPIASPESSPYGVACKAVSDAGIVLVVAAGNEGQNLDLPEKYYDWQKMEWVDLRGLRAYPACFSFDNMVTVGSMASDWEPSSFSNRSPNFVHLAAPGSDIISTLPGNRYDKDSGTSMASPHVAGAAALIAAKHPRKSAADIKARILGNVILNGNWTGRVLSGGFLNIAAAVRAPDPKVPVRSLEASPASLSMSGRTSADVAVSMKPANASDGRLLWFSDNPSVATVEPTEAGAVISSLSDGRATIKAFALGGGVFAKIPVVVKNAGPAVLGDTGGCLVSESIGPGALLLLAALWPLLKRARR